MEKKENYILLGIRKRHSSKSDRDYYVAYVLYENDYGFDVLIVMIKEEQVKPLEEAIQDDEFNLNEYIRLDYNSYNKRYDLKITYGL